MVSMINCGLFIKVTGSRQTVAHAMTMMRDQPDLKTSLFTSGNPSTTIASCLQEGLVPVTSRYYGRSWGVRLAKCLKQ